MLTSAVNEPNGYGVVSRQLRDGLRALGENVELEIYTRERMNRAWFGKDSLKSELAMAHPFLALLFFLYDILNVLFTLRGRVDAIHSMTEHYAFVAWVLSHILRAPYVITAHGTYSVLMPRRSRLIRFGFGRADQVVAVSRYTRKRLREEGTRMESEVLNWGVDKGIFHPGPVQGKEKVVTFVGNFKPRKGFFWLLEAFRIVNREDPHVRLQVIGKMDNGPADYPKAAALVREWGLNVEFLGFVDTPGLVEKYRKARLNVLPSRSEPDRFEGFGLIHLEANACGTLTLGTRDSGNEDAVREGFGYLVGYGDTASLAERILEVMRLPEYPSLDADRLPSWEDVARDYLDLFRRARDSAKEPARPVPDLEAAMAQAEGGR